MYKPTKTALRRFIVGISCMTVVLLSLVLRQALEVTSNSKPLSQGDGHLSTLSFSPDVSIPIAMHYEATTVRYGLNGPDSDEEFAKLLPLTGHTIHMPSSSGASHSNETVIHTVTLFHQLKCLDIIRREYGDAYPSTPELTQHCLIYLHQTILCRPYIVLEVTKNSFATGRKSRELVCRDWEAIYREAARNWELYSTSNI